MNGLKQLQAMSDEELTALAATKVMGWILMPADRHNPAYWMDGDHSLLTFMKSDYAPTVDYNQSHALLMKMVVRGARFEVSYYGHLDMDDISVFVPDYNYDDVVSGNDARAQTVAAILAAEAMGEKTQ